MRISNVCFHIYHPSCSYYCIAKKKHGSLGNPVAVDEEGLLLDVDVQLADKDPPMREDKWRDVNQFFHAPVEKEIGGKKKKQCICKLCP
jgi:hypothetical protein